MGGGALNLWLVGVGLVCLISGVLLLIMGMRGRRLDRHPVCRKCRFDLQGVFPGREVCPECGVALASAGSVRAGNRRRRPGMAATGALLLFSGMGAAGYAGYSIGRNVQWIRLKPAWLLVMDARGADVQSASVALEELARRISAGSLSESRGRSLADEGLTLQADADAAWRGGWGDVVEAAHAAGFVPHEEWVEYIRRSVTVSFVARPMQRAGGDIHCEIRVAPSRTGSKSTMLAVAEQGEVRIGGLTLDEEMFFGRLMFSRGGTGSFRGSGSIAGLAPGAYELEASYVVGIGQGEDWQEADPITTIAGETSLPIELVGPDAELVKLIEDEEELEFLSSMMRVQPVKVQSIGQSMLRVSTSVMFGSRDYAMAFDVFLRDETGREWPMNSGAVIAAGMGGHGFGAGMIIEAPFEPAKLDLVLRASPRSAEKNPEVTEILGGTIIVPDMEVVHEEPP